MTNLSKGKFCAMNAIVPPDELRKEFHRITAPMFDQVKLLLKEKSLLSQTRDLLLNRLISGKLRVDALDIQFPPARRSD